MWALILAPACVPLLKNNAPNCHFQIDEDTFFHGGHFVCQSTMSQDGSPYLILTLLQSWAVVCREPGRNACAGQTPP